MLETEEVKNLWNNVVAKATSDGNSIFEKAEVKEYLSETVNEKGESLKSLGINFKVMFSFLNVIIDKKNESADINNPDTWDILPQEKGEENSTVDKPGYNELENLLNDTSDGFINFLETEGCISHFVNAIRTGKKHAKKEDVETALIKVAKDLEFLRAAYEGRLMCGDKTVDFETAFKTLMGVNYSEENIKDCNEKSETYAKADSINKMVNSLIDELNHYSKTNGAASAIDNPVKFNKSFLTLFSQLLNIQDYEQINSYLAEFCEKYKDNPDMQKYGGEIKLVKLNDKEQNYYGQEYALMRKTDAGNWEPLTSEQMQLIADYTINEKLVPVKAVLLGLGADSTNEDCENYVAQCKKDYEEAFKTAYGTQELSTLLDEYIQGQQKGMMAVNIASSVAMMVATMFTGGAASAVMMGLMMTQPIELLEKLTDGDGATWKDIEEHGYQVLKSLPWMALGMGAGKLGDLARAACKLKGLQTLANRTGKTIDQIIKEVGENNLGKDAVNLLKQANKIAQATGFTTEVCVDLATTRAFQKEGLTTQDWIMSFVGALQGTVMQKKLAGMDSKSAQTDYVQKQFKGTLDLTADEAKMVIENMINTNNLPRILDDIEVTAPGKSGKKAKMGLGDDVVQLSPIQERISKINSYDDLINYVKEFMDNYKDSDTYYGYYKPIFDDVINNIQANKIDVEFPKIKEFLIKMEDYMADDDTAGITALRELLPYINKDNIDLINKVFTDGGTENLVDAKSLWFTKVNFVKNGNLNNYKLILEISERCDNPILKNNENLLILSETYYGDKPTCILPNFEKIMNLKNEDGSYVIQTGQDISNTKYLMRLDDADIINTNTTTFFMAFGNEYTSGKVLDIIRKNPNSTYNDLSGIVRDKIKTDILSRFDKDSEDYKILEKCINSADDESLSDFWDDCTFAIENGKPDKINVKILQDLKETNTYIAFAIKENIKTLDKGIAQKVEKELKRIETLQYTERKKAYSTLNDALTSFKKMLSDNPVSSEGSYSDELMKYLEKDKPDVYKDLTSEDKENLSDFIKNVKKDLDKARKVEDLVEYFKKQPDSELGNVLYEKYLDNEFKDKPLKERLSIKRRCLEINKKYGVKIILPTDLNEANFALKLTEDELANFKTTSKGKAKLPPTIDFLSAKQDYLEGQCSTVGFCQPHSSGSISLRNMTVDIVTYALRHELTHANDLKLLNEFPDGIVKNIGTPSADDNEIVFITLDTKNCKYYDEFKNAGITEGHISYAYNNPKEFIAVAAEGDMSKYSPEFKKVLVDFGMPKWMLDLPPKPKLTWFDKYKTDVAKFTGSVAVEVAIGYCVVKIIEEHKKEKEEKDDED